jgi:carbonic anhydrase
VSNANKRGITVGYTVRVSFHKGCFVTTPVDERLIPVLNTDDILPQYRNRPIGLLLEYQNLNRPLDSVEHAQILVGMCMDNRKHLRIPDNFAYIIRAGGANLRYSEFKVSYAIAVGGVSSIAIIGHNNCGMANLMTKHDLFVNGLVEHAGWDRQRAEEHFAGYAPMFEIGNEVDFVLSEVERLRRHYPNVQVAPMLYQIETNLISLIRED